MLRGMQNMNEENQAFAKTQYCNFHADTLACTSHSYLKDNSSKYDYVNFLLPPKINLK